jgi:hypothetical protein
MIAHPIADLESTIYVSESSVAQFYSLIHHKPYEPFYKDKTAKTLLAEKRDNFIQLNHGTAGSVFSCLCC